jgi:septum site-determining protein MinC
MLDTMFATETMAELSARQGRLADAVAIYRHLLGDAGADGERIAKWKARLAELEGGPVVLPPPVAVAPRPAAPPPRAPSAAEAAAAVGQRPSLVIREPVRSGQVIYADERDLIVVASVNSGAQLLADGNIHIYGALKGRAVAGAHGMRDAQVFCLTLEAELVGVDTGYLLSDDISQDLWGTPARVSLSADGKCTVTALPVGKSTGPVATRARRFF